MATQGCHLSSEWNMLDAAPAYSAFAGILAGFLFLAVITLMTERRSVGAQAKTVNRSRPLMLFLPALLCLMVSSFLFGEVSGDQVCARGYVGGIFASSVLGIGALAGFTGIVWMLEAHGESDESLKHTTIIFIYVSYLVVIASLLVGCIDLTNSAFHNKPPVYAIAPLVAYGPGLLISVAVTRKWFMPNESSSSRAQVVAVYVPYAYVVITIITLGLLNSFHPAEWRSIDDWKVYLTLGLALLFPALSVITCTRTLPGVHHKASEPASLHPPREPLPKRVN